nr:hypothetical protein [Budvicia aquatica]
MMELDEGEIIVTLATGTATGTGQELTLTDNNGDPISSVFYQNIYNTGGSAPAALGSFNYGMTTGNNYDGLYVNYGLKALELLSTGNDALILTATLANNGKQSNDLSAQITGSGDLAFVSANDGSTVSLSNSTNTYTGATWVRSGNLRLDADGGAGANFSVGYEQSDQCRSQWDSAAHWRVNYGNRQLAEFQRWKIVCYWWRSG